MSVGVTVRDSDDDIVWYSLLSSSVLGHFSSHSQDFSGECSQLSVVSDSLDDSQDLGWA